MTRRAIILGFIAAITFAAGGRYINAYMPGPALVRGQLPMSVFGLLMLFVLVINPLLGRIRKSWRFGPSEVALILALLLGVSTIIDAGLMRYFPSICVYPMHAERTSPGWQRTGVVNYVPDSMLVNDGVYSEEAVGRYFGQGEPIARPSPWYKPDSATLSEFINTLSLSWRRVPWEAWRKPLLFWGAVLALIYSCVVALSVIVHRQWARKERITYPLAEIASSMLVEPGDGRVPLLHKRILWLGFVIPLAIAIVNLPSLWYPDTIRIPLDIDFSVLNARFPDLMRVPGARFLASFKLYPAAIGIAFLLASDVSFGLGVSNVISVLVIYFLINIGVDTSGGGAAEGGVVGYQNFGAYLGYAFMLFYVGRQYYLATVKQAITFSSQTGTDASSARAMRVVILCLAALAVILTLNGMPWHISILGVLMVMLAYIVIARLSAEAGAFFCMPSWTMSGILLGLYGFSAIGPKAFLGMSLVAWVLTGSPFESLMPFAVNGIKTASDAGLKASRVGTLIAVTVIMALAATLFTGIWTDYQKAASPGAGRFTSGMYSVAERNIARLNLADELERSVSYTSWERFRNINPDRTFLVWTSIGFFLVLGLTAARLKWPWWPLHPVILLTFGSAVMVGRYGPSILLGWLIKMLVVKLAGAAKYMELRPMMVGVIAGDIMGGFITMTVLWAYYIVTGTTGPSWQFW